MKLLPAEFLYSGAADASLVQTHLWYIDADIFWRR
jgi:hypothetical protein